MSEASASLLGRRLERLRQADGCAAPALHGLPTPRADVLAAALGGTAVGRTVVVQSAVRLPLERSRLDGLPYRVDPGRPLLCLDTETTGLATAAGTLPFLIGLGSWHGERLEIRQLLAPDHADEASMLDLLGAAIPADAWLVTYNGRSFDWPLLVARYRLHRRDPPPVAGQLDLLPVARGLWKHRLGNARLATVEEAVAGVRRRDDLPGALIPERYFTYLRQRQPELLRPVLEHNRQDIISLALLLAVLARLPDRSAWRQLHPGDLGMLGRAYGRVGAYEPALACLAAALSSVAWQEGVVAGAAVWRRLAADRARLLARLGRRDEAVAAWLELARRGGPGAAVAWLHIARHREHAQRDYAGALGACHEALAIVERARLWGRLTPGVERDLAHRMARLRRRATGNVTRLPGAA